MPTNREILEDELARRPADLTLHLAYADLLTDLGDPRGEFIRLQVQLEDPALPPDRKAQCEAGVAALLAAHAKDWLGPLAEPVNAGGRVTWERGWVTGLRVRRLTLDFVEAVPRSPVTRPLSDLAVHQPFLGDDGLALLLTASWLRRIRTLDLSRCDITDDGAERLAAHPAVRGLKRLRLDDNLLSPIGIEALRAVGHANLGPQRFGGTPRLLL